MSQGAKDNALEQRSQRAILVCERVPMELRAHGNLVAPFALLKCA